VHKKRLFRISLRALLVLLTVFCIWLGKISIQARRQKEAVEWVVQCGGQVHYKWQVDADYFPRWKPTDPFPKWLVNLFGRDFFHKVVTVELASAELSDIRPLANLPDIEWLTLQDNKVSDVTPLGTLTHLTNLGLNENRIRDVSSLANLTRMMRLDISGNCIDDIGALSEMRHLWELQADRNRISDIEPLGNLKQLEVITLSENRIRDIRVFSTLTKLETLDLGNNQIDDWTPLRNLETLNLLEVDGNDVTPEELESLRKWHPDIILYSTDYPTLEFLGIMFKKAVGK